MSPHVSTLSKVLLVADRDAPRPEATVTKVRRYRLARLELEGACGRDPLAALKRAYD